MSININKKGLSLIKTQTSALENKINLITIQNKDNYVEAITLLNRINAMGKIIKLKKELITKPLNESLRNARELFKPLEDQFLNAEKIIKKKMLDYSQEVNKIAQEKEEKIAERMEKGIIKLETAEKKINEVDRIKKTTQGSYGKVTIRQTRKVRIVNLALIPREYFIPDMILIRNDALSGKNIAGVEVYLEDNVSL